MSSKYNYQIWLKDADGTLPKPIECFDVEFVPGFIKVRAEHISFINADDVARIDHIGKVPPMPQLPRDTMVFKNIV